MDGARSASIFSFSSGGITSSRRHLSSSLHIIRTMNNQPRPDKDSWIEETLPGSSIWEENPLHPDRALSTPTSKRQRVRKNDPPSAFSLGSSSSMAKKHVSVSIPCVYGGDGLSMAPRGHLSIASTVPCTTNVHFRLQGDVHMRVSTGFATCRSSLGWRLPARRHTLSAGLALPEGRPLPAVGYQYAKPSSVPCGTTSFQTTLNGKQLLLSALYPTQNGRLQTRLALHHRSRSQPAVSATWISPYRWQLGLKWNEKDRRPVLSLSTQPKLSQHRTLDLFASVSSVWSLGARLHQQVTQSSRISMGLHYNMHRRLTWTYAWSDKEWNVFIPIHVPQAGGVATLFATVVSWMIQYFLHHVLAQHLPDSGAVAAPSVDDEQERRHAQHQQVLMAKQAQKRSLQEQEKRGLVIERAVYYYKDGDSMNVTIPLQFWVYESSLDLSDASKSTMLGICKLKPLERTKEDPVDRSWSLWTRCWSSNEPEPDRNDAGAVAGPFLAIEYVYAGVSYEVTIHDTQSLVLP